jgi:hypothetical protein
VSPPVDPVLHGIRTLVTGAHGEAIADVTVPAGAWDESTKRGWKVNRRRTSWRYRKVYPSGGADGAVVRGDPASGDLRFSYRGHHGSHPFTAPMLPPTLGFVVDAPTAETGQCGEKLFAASRCRASANGRNFRCH